uniref:Tripartite motif-containing protein 3 n=1 Tax=Magallana gigas TaxID=29159 RepID=K1Q1E5_MAGGI
MDTASSTYRAHKCSKCPGDTEYHCVSCPCDLCPQCKENHVKDLKTIDHDVVSHRDKINYIPTQEICVRHPSHVYTKYCEPCQVPVCGSWFGHKSHKLPVRSFLCGQRKHTILDIQTAYKTKQQQHRGTIHTIRSEALFYRPVLLPRIKTDFKTCRTEFSLYQSEMLTKAQTLKNLINKVRKDFMKNVFCDFDFKHRCLKQMIEMSRHIVSLQEYELRYVQPEFTFSALQFLSFTKTEFPQIHLTLHTSQLSMTESLNKEDVMESLSAIQITERGNRRVGNQCLLKLTSGAELHQSLTLTGVDWCLHISCVTSDRVWVSDWNNLMLIDTTGVPLHRVEDSWSGYNRGIHTVNSESELIYIDRNFNINKLSKDMKTTTTFIERTDSTWIPRCVYWSPSTGDLLVAMDNYDTETGKVTRYNQSGQLTQTIQNDNTGRGLYREPNYITENNNGDVVVSDLYSAVVVTEHGGRHRFSYTGHPSGSELEPHGICTDPLSHILVCDGTTKTVQMINSDGQFLSHLLIRPSGIFYPHSLSYDVNTHRLWVGSGTPYNNTVVIYRYITRQDALTDLNPATADVMESLSEIPTTGTEKPQQGNQCLLKLMSPPELLPSLTLTGVDRCYHISCVTSDRVWVSDRNKLMLTDTTGVPLHRVEDSCSYLYGDRGLHTVNSESELIYIDRNYNINKLSKDMKTTTTFIERTDFTWRPRCVYWSPSTGDLLVGMYNYRTGKVTRYNQSGQLTQTIQNDNTGMGLYNIPCYITENNNRDVVVSDDDAVVVTERGGRHRFSYTGHPSGSRLWPRGICTDPLSHILVCDGRTETVQMLDRDGQFLSHLLIRPSGIFSPWSLSYDVITHRLWVGSGNNNTVVIYRYITRQDALTDEHTPCPDEDAMFRSTPAVEWR